MKNPAIHDAESLRYWLNTTGAELPDGRYVPARPLAWTSIGQRWKAAWLVFTGKADTLTWPGQ